MREELILNLKEEIDKLLNGKINKNTESEILKLQNEIKEVEKKMDRLENRIIELVDVLMQLDFIKIKENNDNKSE